MPTVRLPFDSAGFVEGRKRSSTRERVNSVGFCNFHPIVRLHASYTAMFPRDTLSYLSTRSYRRFFLGNH